MDELMVLFDVEINKFLGVLLFKYLVFNKIG